VKQVRGARAVEKLLRQARREVRAALKELNQQAGKLMSRGDYSGATSLAGVAQTIAGFEEKIAGLRREWRGLWRAPRDEGAKDETTPLWEYYRLILQALEALNGQATRQQIEEYLEPRVAAALKPGDLKASGRRRLARWRVMVRRARKEMVKQKYLEDRTGTAWRITALGRDVARGDVTAAER
jgi:hypothetical protein